MKLSDVKGERAMEMTADLLIPLEAIFSNPETLKFLRSGEHSKFQLASHLLKNNKKAILEILAIIHEDDFEHYVTTVNMATLPVSLLEILNDKELMSLFISQGQTVDATVFGSVLGNTEE